MTVVWVVPEVWGVQTKQEGWENGALWHPHAADYHLRHTFMKPYVLWSVGEVVDGPRSQLLVHSGSLQLPSKQCRLDGVESPGEVEKHDPHSAPHLLQVREGLVQQIDDDILHSDTRPAGKLQGALSSPEGERLVQDEPL